ncbi:hypothetical protein BCL76_109101 [Streptomyces sp. CG 926]|nr:hypothetical protein BCL76_109101 [Streptomyces sp. CG 926]
MIAKDARPMTDAERRRLIRLIFGPRPTPTD